MSDDHEHDGKGRLLARLDERSARMEIVQKRQEFELREIRERLDRNFVTRPEFDASRETVGQRFELVEAKLEPIRRLVYGVVAVALLAIVTALVQLVITGGS